MESLIPLIPLLPLVAALIIGIGQLFNLIEGEADERLTANIASWTITSSCWLTLILLIDDSISQNSNHYFLGNWLNSDNLSVSINFICTGFSLRLAALFSTLLAIACYFSIHYLHREPGYHRFFSILCLFASAIELLVLSGNAVLTFIGWEIAGLCSYLLIAYAYDRPIAVNNATRVFITNRFGDAAFLLGIGLCYNWLGSADWSMIQTVPEQLSRGQTTALALCFSIAAFAKSAQLPFSPWLSRAMEGPTPSSAIFYGAVLVHAGIYLLILLEPLFAHAPLARGLLTIVGLSTAFYAYITGLSQTDAKSSLIFACSAQLGLMVMECGLGFWSLASWHLCAHAVVRSYQLLTAPSLMHNLRGFASGNTELKSVPTWLYMASLQRFWLDPITDWALIKPVRGLSHDLSYFDDHIIDRIMGSPGPAVQTISSLAQLEEQIIGARLDNDSDQFAQGSGLAGKLTEWSAAIVYWFEDRFVLRGLGRNAIHYGRRLGHAANRFERSVLRPRYLVLFVGITLLIAL